MTACFGLLYDYTAVAYVTHVKPSVSKLESVYNKAFDVFYYCCCSILLQEGNTSVCCKRLRKYFSNCTNTKWQSSLPIIGVVCCNREESKT